MNLIRAVLLCSMCENKGDGSIMNKAYERETEMWNQVFKECTPVDLRTLDLQVETMFDEALKLFAQKTTNVLDFGCGTGDISFNICSISLHIKF